MNDQWECYLCGLEDDFDNEPSGYLGNYHPICLRCANDVYYSGNHEDRFRLTYHGEFGDLMFFENALLLICNHKLN